MSGIDHLFRGMRISSSGLAAERVRIDTIAQNIANARTTSTPDGGPYRRRLVVFEPLVEKLRSGEKRVMGVRAARVVPDLASPMQIVHDPSHPDADEEGLVELPNVNATREMADLITALRAYEANAAVKEAFERMAERALEVAR